MNLNSPHPYLIRIAAFLGLTGVALGAFGAHGLKSLLLQHQTLEIWKTASFYHISHAILLLILASVFSHKKTSFYLFTTGILLFSGSLYLLALFPYPWLGPITPLGGALLLAGWISLIAKPH